MHLVLEAYIKAPWFPHNKVFFVGGMIPEVRWSLVEADSLTNFAQVP